MDVTTLRDSKEALFADIMAAANKPSSATTSGNCQRGQAERDGKESAAAVELRKKSDKKGRRYGAVSPKKLRPQSMITIPSNTPSEMLSSSMNSFLGKGFFARPKAFFGSEQQLAERVKEYNRKKEDAYKLKLVSTTSQEDICSGLLKFHYSDGLDTFTENLHIQSRSTIGEILPDLITTFLPHEYQMAAIDGTQPTSVSLVQGKMERDLDVHEKPLEIVLDCSSRGLASPKFLFKCPLPTMGIPLTPHRTSRTGRPGGLDFSSEFGHNLSQPDHHTSMTSLGSGMSMSSSRSGKSKSTSSLTPKQKKKKLSLPQHQPGTNQSMQSPSAMPRLHLSVQNDAAPSPSTGKSGRSSKATAVSNFFSRSLRGRKKSKPVPLGDSPPNSLVQDSNDEREDEEELDDYDDDYDDGPINFAADTSTSPHVNLERAFTLSTVMHIYFAEGKQAQVYKSVLVSEKATTRQLIKQALERYNMKCEDPDTFALFDVIGKWQDVTGAGAGALKTQLHYQGNNSRKDNGRRMGANAISTLPNLNILNASPLQHRAAVEEFVVCYSRELDADENPYKMQFYLTAQEGFSRRFELRSKLDREQGRMRAHFHEKSHSVDIMERPDEATPTPDILEDEDDLESSGIFGDTVHRKRAKRNRILHPSVDSADPDTSITILDPAEDENEPVNRVVSGGKIGGLGKIYSSKRVVRGSRIMQAEDHEDSEIPIAMNTSFAPNFSKLGYSSPDSGVEFQKGARQSNSNKSSVSSEQSDSGNTGGGAGATDLPSLSLCPGNLDSAFLLSLRLCDPHRESLVYKLNEDSTEILAESTESSKQNGKIFLVSSEGDDKKQQVLCTICRCSVSDLNFRSNHSEESVVPTTTDSANPLYKYNLLQGCSKLPIFHNGEPMADSASLKHGDLVSIGSTYLFMFQDYAASSKGDAGQLKYSWRPQICSPVGTEERRKSSSSRETIVEMSTKTVQEVQNFSSVGDQCIVQGTNLSYQPQVSEKSSTNKTESPTATRVNYSVTSLQEPQKITVTSANHMESSVGIRGSSSLATTATMTRVPVTSGLSDEESVPCHSPSGGVGRKKMHSPRSAHKTRAEKLKSGHHKSVGKTYSLPLPKDRKLVFSFKVTEEDKLLKHVVSESRKGKEPASCLRHSSCKLAPAYILAMCTEYCSMTSGPQAVARFVQKATDRIQEVVWECTNRLSSWQPNMEALQKPLQQKQELFPLLEPVFFWLANSLEYYHFLDSQRSSLRLDATPCDPADDDDKRKKDKRKHGGQEEEEEEEDKPMEILYSILVYIYQQAFYPISKVLYQSLPLMLESCIDQEGEGPPEKPDSTHNNPIVIGQAVEFLQALLDMMTEQSIHLEVISQFFANIFFFVNAAMFNGLLEQGSDLGLFQHYSGLILRENLDLFEGWACQVGFKDAVLCYLARFSGAIDFLATPTEKLLQLNWSELCSEFPVLHPAQLHYLLSQYLLPVPSSAGLPRHWTPTEEDATIALSRESLLESFDGHPGFHLPSSNYVLDLNHPPPESEDFQEVLEALHTSLHKNGRSTPITTNVLENGGTISIDRTSPTPPELNGSRRIRRRDTEPGSDTSSSFQRTLRENNMGSSTESQEDLLTVGWRNLENSQRKKPNSRSPSLDTSPSQKPKKTKSKGEGSPVVSKLVEKPSSNNKVETAKHISDSSILPSKEKRALQGRNQDNHVRVYPSSNTSDVPQPGGWTGNNFPQGSRTVTIPRGDKGFGLVMAEKKVAGGDSRLFVKQLMLGSTACGLPGLVVGDQVLAIEGQPLNGADYRIAQKYLKEAEDEISLTLAPRTGKK